MYILAESSCTHIINDTLPDLHQEIITFTGARIRRIDRYIQLCLVGALNCIKHHPLTVDTDLILSSGNGTVSTVAKIMETVYRSHYSPKPLHFVNSLGNSACHFLARALNICGSSTVISQGYFSFEASVMNATVQLENTNNRQKKIIIGGVDEAPLPLEHQKRRLNANVNITHMYEGSHWMILSSTPPENAPQISITTPEYFETLEEIALITRVNPSDTYFNFIATTEQMKTLGISDYNHRFPLEYSQPHRAYSGKLITEAATNIRKGNAKKVRIINYDEEANRYCYTTVSSI